MTILRTLKFKKNTNKISSVSLRFQLEITKMNIKTSLLVVLLLGLSTSIFAQRNKKKPFPLSVSYFGNNLTRPGLIVSASPFPWGNKSITESPKRFSFLHQASIGFFVTPKTNTNLFVTTEPGIRLSSKGGFRFETFIGLGYLRSFNAGTTYTVTENSIEKVSLASRGYFLTHLTLGIGKDLFPKRGIPVAWHIRPAIFVLTPYNTGFNLLLNFEFGLTYTLNAKREIRRRKRSDKEDKIN